MRAILLILLTSYSLTAQIKPDSVYVINPINKEVLIIAKTKKQLLKKLDSLIKVRDLKEIEIKNFYKKGIKGSYIIRRKQ